jgi:hypothetical protein
LNPFAGSRDHVYPMVPARGQTDPYLGEEEP